MSKRPLPPAPADPRAGTKVKGGGVIGQDGDVHLKKTCLQRIHAIFPSLTKLELIITYLQLLGLILLVDVGWDKEVTDATDWVNFTVWDIRKPNVGVVEFRAHFLVIVCIFPLLFTFFMLMFLQSFVVVTWYFILLASLTCFAAGFTVKLLPSNEFTRTTPSDYFFYAGLFGLAFVLIAHFVYKVYLKRRAERLKKEYPGAGLEEREYADWRRKENMRRMPRPWWALLLEFCFMVFCAIVGLIAVGALSFRENEKASLSGPLKALMIAFGQGLIFIAIVTFIHLVLVLFSWGRDFLAGLLDILRNNFVRFMLFILSIGYIPAANMTLSVFNCFEGTCPQGETYPNKDILLSNFARDGFTSRARTDMCEPCRYAEQCPGDFFFCDEVTDWRLAVDPSLSCRTHMWPYYIFAAFFMGLAMVAGIPWLYRRVTKDSSTALGTIPCPGSTPAVRWFLRTSVSKNTANHLYSPFMFGSRFYRLILIFFKLLAVCLTLFLTRHPGYAISCLAGSMFLGTLVTLWKRPYINEVDGMLAVAFGLNNTINALLGVGVYRGMDMPAYSVGLVFILNIAIPLVLMLVGAVISRRYTSTAKALINKESKGQVTGNNQKERVLIRQAKLTQLPSLREYYAKFQKENRLLMIREAQMESKKKKKRKHKYKDGAKEEKQGLTGAGGATQGEPGALPPLMSKNGGGSGAEAGKSGDGVKKTESLFRGKNAQKHIQVAKHFQKADIHLDIMSLKTLTSYFAVLGTIAFVAVMVVLVGIVYSSVTTTFVPHEPTVLNDSPDFISLHEFAGNDDWEIFIEDCCCGVGDPSEDYLVVEIWQCLNGFYKQKVRRQRVGDTIHDGLLLRGLCEKTFEPGVCGPYYEETEQSATALNFYKTEVCSPKKYGTTKEEPTDLALRRLW